MALVFRFYGPNGALDTTVTNDVLIADYLISLNGQASGDVRIKVTSANKTFLKSLKRHSHFTWLKDGAADAVGGVVDDAVINRGVCTVTFIGFYDYLDRMELIASHKAAIIDNSVVIAEKDQSYIKTFYADSAMGLLYGLLRNLRKTITTRGDYVFWVDTALKSTISSSTDANWAKSYRLNSVDSPTVRSVVEDVLTDDDLAPITVSVTTTGGFKWVLNTISTYPTYTLEEGVDSIVIGDVTRGDLELAKYSMISGTDLEGRDVMSFKEFKPALVYSTNIASSPADGTKNIQRLNDAAIKAGSRKDNQISFNAHSSIIPLLAAVTLKSDRMDDITGIVTEIKVSGQSVNYTMQIITPGVGFITGLKKPVDFNRRMIFNPLKFITGRTKKNSFKKSRPTGWRS